MSFSPIEEILDELRAGRMIVLLDDERRENEGDLVCAAEKITPEAVNFMTKAARGMLCVALDSATCGRLDLHPQSQASSAHLGTAYTISVDAGQQFGVTTGISAADRSATIRLLADPTATSDNFYRPGHVQPLKARDGGVLVRTGQTEGSVDLCRLGGLQPAAAIIEIMNDDGTMARLDELRAVCKAHGLKMCCVADVIAHRLEREKCIERIDEASFQTEEGEFDLIAYRSDVDVLPHVALCKGRVGRQDIDEPVLVRMHSQNLLGDVFGSADQPSGRTLREAMRQIQAAGEGAVVYLRCEGMGTGLLQRLQTLHPAGQWAQVAGSEQSAVASAAYHMDYGVGSQILRDLGVRKLRLMTNHPHYFKSLEGFGLSIVEMVPVGIDAAAPG